MSTPRNANEDPAEFDRRMTLRAIALAGRGQGRVEPNPLVGCVVVKNGKVVGEGYHRRFGGPHAEVDALGRCGRTARGATLYVSLEPCCHHGKTPPCTEAIIRAGVARVVVGVRDPHPLVRGKGVRALRRAGITVDTGVCRAAAAERLAPFATRLTRQRPYVIAKWAQSLDGKLATRTGDARWISCEASRREVHRLRARVDAVLVGIGTVLADDPRLNARSVRMLRRAIRVAVDTRLRIPLNSRLATTANDGPVLVLTSAASARTPRAQRLRDRGIDVVGCRTRGGRVALDDGLRRLAARDVTNLMVEGGPAILTSLLKAGSVDEAVVFVAPILIGGASAPSVLMAAGAATVSAALRPRAMLRRRFGDDTMYHLRLTPPPR